MRNLMNASAAASEPMPVGFLIRVSTSKQVDKVSLQEQEAACERKRLELSAELGRTLVLVAVYRDAGVSGDGRDRDALRAALTDITTEKIQYLIAYELDRLTREPAQAGEVLRTCVNAGARVHFYKNDVRYNEETGDLLPSDEIMYYLTSVMGKHEKRRTLERTQRDRLALVGKGVQVQRGHAPYGYRIWQTWEHKAGRCPADQVGKYEIIPELSPIVLEIFERVARRESLRSIGKTLQERGIASPSGAVIWYPGTVQMIVTNTAYKGKPHYGRQTRRSDARRETQGKNRDFTVKMPEETWQFFDAPAIVTPELWQSANDAIATNKAFSSGREEHRFLLSTFLRCPHCGAAMNGRRSGGDYYTCCRDYTKRAGDPNRAPCPMKYVRVPTIEARFADALLFACQRPEIVAGAVSDYMDAMALAARGDSILKERDRLVSEQSRLMRRAQLLRREIVTAQENEEEADTTGFRSDLATANASLAEISVRLATMPEPRKIADTLPAPQEAAGKVTAMLSRLPEAVASPVMTVGEKRWLLDAVLLRVEPIEGTKGVRGKVDWSCVVTLKPEAWGGSASSSVCRQSHVHADEPVLGLSI